MDNRNFAGRILQLTLEIIYLLTGEDYIIMKKSSDHVTSRCHSGQRKNQNPIMEHSPPSPDEQKILEVANSIIHLLTGEVLGCLEDCEDQHEVALDEPQPLTSQSISRSSSKLEALCFGKTSPSHCEEGEHVGASHQVSKWPEEDSITECFQDEDKLQAYQLCPSPCDQGPAASASGHGNFGCSLVHIKEELGSRRQCDLEGGQHAQVEASTLNQQQAYKVRSKGRKSLNMPSRYGQVNGQLSASSTSIPKTKPYECLERADTNLPHHQTHRRGSASASSLSSMPCDREDATSLGQQELQYNLGPVMEDLGLGKECPKGDIARAASSAPRLLPQSRSRKSTGPSNVAKQEDMEYTLVEIKEESLLGECDLAKTPQGTAQAKAQKGRSEGPLNLLKDAKASSGRLSQPSTPVPSTLSYQCTECPMFFSHLSELIQHQTSHQESMLSSCPASRPTSSARDHKDLDYFLVRVKEEFGVMEKEVLEIDDVTESESSVTDDIVQLEASDADCDNAQGQPLYCDNVAAESLAGPPDQLGLAPIPNAKTYRCLECPNVYNCRSDLLKHQTHHRGSTLFTCCICEKNFTSKSNLAKHHKIHTGEKPYSCDQCGKRFREKHYLVSHQSVHSGAQLITCPVCGKGYTSKSNLAKHQRIHTGQKPFACSVCSKSFNQRSVLLAHQRTHTGEKPFSCQLCQRCFTDKLQLERHQVTHTGEKPFSCSECGKSFSRKHALVKHLANH